jgi:hypothetical protein
VMGKLPSSQAKAWLISSFSTVRPVKNVDKTRTSRLSADFMGSGSVRRQIAPHEIIPPVPRRQPVSEKGRAGEVLVEEVILGVLDAVSWLLPRYMTKLTSRHLEKIMMPKLSRLSI